MSASKVAVIRCDVPRCPQQHVSEQASVNVARGEASRLGWAMYYEGSNVGSGPNKRPRDYCPSHDRSEPLHG